MKLLNPQEKTLNDYLQISSGKLAIPFTQRPYTWEKDNILRLFDDLTSIYFNKDKSQHVLNFIVTYDKDDAQYIFDGQQRTITCLLLINAILNEIARNEGAAQDWIIDKRRDFLGSTNSVDGTKMKFYSDNKDAQSVLVEILLGVRMSELDQGRLSKDHTEKLYDAEKTLNKAVHEFFNDREMTLEQMYEFFEYIMHNTFLVQITAASNKIANDMFESLNNTGQPIEQYYVLKNTCCSKSPNIQEEWDQLDYDLSSISKSDFLTAVATLHHGKTLKNKSLEVIEQTGKLDTKKTVDAFIKELLQHAKNFKYIKNTHHLFEHHVTTEEEKGALKKFIDISNRLRFVVPTFRQHHVILLALLSKEYSFNDIVSVLMDIEKYVFRNLMICNERGNVVEKDFSEFAKHIYNDEINIATLKQKINKILKDDEAIREHLNTTRLTTSTETMKVKKLLMTVYDFENRNETFVNKNTKEIELEHILPQNIDEKGSWKKNFSDAEAREKYAYNLGNLTLLLKEDNIQASNKDFIDKRVDYEKSSLPQNNKISQNKEWTKKEIEERNNQLIDSILELWKKDDVKATPSSLAS